MRALFVILLFVAAACGGDDPEPTYTSIAGRWEFSSDRVSGEFEIFESGGKFYVDNTNGDFSIDGVNSNIGNKTEITLNGFSIDNMILRESDTGNYISFYFALGDVSSDYTTINFTKCTYKKGSDGSHPLEFNPDLIVTRSN